MILKAITRQWMLRLQVKYGKRSWVSKYSGIGKEALNFTGEEWNW
jgi:hypothetical protein